VENGMKVNKINYFENYWWITINITERNRVNLFNLIKIKSKQIRINGMKLNAIKLITVLNIMMMKTGTGAW